MIIYVAGKMRGLPDLGRSAFYSAEKRLNEMGHIALNPARLPVGMQDSKYMPICLAMLDAADIVLMLEGWENSAGAKVEHSYAKLQGKKIVYEKDGWTL